MTAGHALLVAVELGLLFVLMRQMIRGCLWIFLGIDPLDEREPEFHLVGGEDRPRVLTRFGTVSGQAGVEASDGPAPRRLSVVHGDRS